MNREKTIDQQRDDALIIQERLREYYKRTDSFCRRYCEKADKEINNLSNVLEKLSSSSFLNLNKYLQALDDHMLWKYYFELGGFVIPLSANPMPDDLVKEIHASKKALNRNITALRRDRDLLLNRISISRRTLQELNCLIHDWEITVIEYEHLYQSEVTSMSKEKMRRFLSAINQKYADRVSLSKGGPYFPYDFINLNEGIHRHDFFLLNRYHKDILTYLTCALKAPIFYTDTDEQKMIIKKIKETRDSIQERIDEANTALRKIYLLILKYRRIRDERLIDVKYGPQQVELCRQAWKGKTWKQI